MWIKKALVVAAWVAAAFVAFVVLIMIEDSGGLELKTFLVIGGLAIWFALSKQMDYMEKTAKERHTYLMAEVKELREWAEENVSLARQERAKNIWKELRQEE